MLGRLRVFHSCGFVIFFVVVQHAHGDLSYSVQEELKPGSVIGNSADKGARYRINAAHDADIGKNSVQSYTLQQNPHFVFSIQTTSAGSKYGELVLDKELDREEQREMKLLLTAVDGGSPQRSGTVVIHVIVLDANDNAPVFSETVYKTSLPENSPVQTPVITVSATDADEGVNGEVTYEFSRLPDKSRRLFSLDAKTGEISVTGDIDYEEGSKYEIFVEAKDGYGLSSEAKVIIDITDVNDNAPVIYLKSLTNPIPENVSPGTEVGIINVQDRDSETNKQVRYFCVFLPIFAEIGQTESKSLVK
uniref:Cadherin domain-containing protein n=1 Tax=Mastacembelus armatus TaxID=205130 RepID=A0A7N8X630_9TELE